MSMTLFGRAGIAVRNDTDVPLLVVLSQLTPLHWSSEPVQPGATWNAGNHVGVGKVWFTVSVAQWDEAAVPTKAGVALRLGTIIAAQAIPVVGQLTFVVVSETPRRALDVDAAAAAAAAGWQWWPRAMSVQ
jgi:hypothetical protein